MAMISENKIRSIALSAAAALQEKQAVFVAIPAQIHLSVNSEFRIYYRNVISRNDLRLWVESWSSSLTVRYYEDHLSLTATASGTFNLPWAVYNENGIRLREGKIRLIADATAPIHTTTAIVIGDSTVNDGRMTQAAQSFFSEAGAHLRLLGTRGNGTHEGHSGWTAKAFCTTASDNPFYKNGFDFSHYMKTQSYSGVQAVVIQLGINDIFAFRGDTYDSTEALGYLQKMVSSILSHDPTLEVIINLPTTPNSNGISFTETYGGTQMEWTYNRNIIRFSEDLLKHFSNVDHVTISASNCILDTKREISDGVHPTADGYHALGKRLFEILSATVNGVDLTVSLLNVSARQRVDCLNSSTIPPTDPRELDVTKCYDSSFSGYRSHGNSIAIDSYFANGTDSFSIRMNTCNGAGMEFPLPDPEPGKTYKLSYAVNQTNMRLYVLKYNPDTTFVSYDLKHTVNDSTVNTVLTHTLTFEDNFKYSIAFIPMTANADYTVSHLVYAEIPTD